MQTKEQKAAYQKQYQEKNKEKLALKRKEWEENNREHYLEYQKNYTKTQRKNKSQYNKEYREKNKEKIRERRKKYREDNRELIVQKQRERYEKWRDKRRVMKLIEKEIYNNSPEKIQKDKEMREKYLTYQKEYNATRRKKKPPLYDKEYREMNKEKLREYHKVRKLKVRYNLTLEVYNSMITVQNNKCFICEKEGNLMVDHCHSSQRVRKLLCNRCNLAIGNFEDNPILLEKAAHYIRSHNFNN